MKCFDKVLIPGVILIDLQKTFDTIELDMLLKILSAVGFSNHGWFKSYLSNRLFGVNVENHYSDPSNITCGYHQASFWDLYCFFNTWMTRSKLLNQICFYMLMTLAMFFRTEFKLRKINAFVIACRWTKWPTLRKVTLKISTD